MQKYAYVLDPRMRHTTKGFINHRLHDMQKQSKLCSVSNQDSTIQMQDRTKSTNCRKLHLVMALYIMTSITIYTTTQLQGELKYRTISTDHLF